MMGFFPKTNGNHHAETNGQILTAANDHENLLTRLKSKEAEIDRLNDEKTRLQSEMDFLKEVAWNPTEDAVMASAAFKTLKAEFEEQKFGADEAKRMGEVAEKRADELVLNQEGFKAAIEVRFSAVNTGIRPPFIVIISPAVLLQSKVRIPRSTDTFKRRRHCQTARAKRRDSGRERSAQGGETGHFR